MIRPIRIWILFGLLLVAVMSATGWLSLSAIRLDRAQAEARRQAALEEKVRLALWRMESALAPVITRESAQPYFSYSAFYPAGRAYTRMFAEIKRGEVLQPSSLLTQTSPHILLHFQFGPDGELTSPQVPTGNMRDLAETAYTNHEKIEASAARLAELQAILSRDALFSLLPQEEARAVAPVRFPAVSPSDETSAASNEQVLRNVMEWRARASSQISLQANVGENISPYISGVSEGAMKPIWFGSALVLARRASVNGQHYVQGCWLNWPAIRGWLVASVKDLLPAADLEPTGPEPGHARSRMLAALPVRLVPGAVSPDLASRMSPIRFSLLLAWLCVLVAAIAVAALLLGAVSLSERRGAFVSAVTHELRSPLTTLRMYTEMLAKGIVKDKEKTREYLNTLRAEADRLGHLVENVLAYARLEGRRASGVETITLQHLLDKVRGRLARRAEEAGMNLIVESEDEMLSLRVRADVSAVEHILFNLVDNACKYAVSASNRLIRLQAGRHGNFVCLRVRDHGPGIDRRHARRLFRPFCRSPRHSEIHAPGAGLGLALSRRLARSMGGDLRLDQAVTNGACFELILPAELSGSSAH